VLVGNIVVMDKDAPHGLAIDAVEGFGQVQKRQVCLNFVRLAAIHDHMNGCIQVGVVLCPSLKPHTGSA